MSIDRIRARLETSLKSAPVPPSHASAPAPDARKYFRKPGRAPGLIFPGGHIASIPCTITDQSGAGACLLMQPGWVNPFQGVSSLRERFTLVMRLDRVEVDCEIVRIEDNEMGVKFLSMLRPLTRKI